MSRETEHFKLILPQGVEYYSVGVANYNSNKIDEELYNINQSITLINDNIDSKINNLFDDLVGGATEGIDSLKDILDMLNDPESGELIKINNAINKKLSIKDNDDDPDIGYSSFANFINQHESIHNNINASLESITNSTSGLIVTESRERIAEDTKLSNRIGNISSLRTNNKNNTVDAINELNTNQGVLSSLKTTIKSNLVNAINENYTTIKEINNTVEIISNAIGTYDKITLNIQTTISESTANYVGTVKIIASFNDDQTTHNYTVYSSNKEELYSTLYIALESYNYNTRQFAFIVGFSVSGRPPYHGHSVLFSKILTNGQSNDSIYGYRGSDDLFTLMDQDTSNNILEEVNNLKNKIGDLSFLYTSNKSNIVNAINENTNNINNIADKTIDITTSVSAYKSIIIAGQDNTINGSYSVILGGYDNNIEGSNENKDNPYGYPITSAIIVGTNNTINNESYNVIVGGDTNINNGNRSAIITSTDCSINNGSTNGIYSSTYSKIYSISQYSAIIGGSYNIIGITDDDWKVYNNSLILGGNNNSLMGSNTVILGGKNNTITGDNIIVLCGSNNEIDDGENQIISGHYSKITSKGSSSGTTGDAFIIGNGSSSATSNAFRVTYNGSVYGSGAFNTSGADYAEMFEWVDGNPDNEDRRGLFVTLDENNSNKIRIANYGDDIIGIVSSTPSIVGNSYDDNWHGMYKKDVFGDFITKTIIIPSEYDDTGKLIKKEETCIVRELSEEYNPDLKYIPRSERNEWTPVGLFGQFIVIDDGSCKPGGRCKCGNNGIATISESGYRVMSRIDDSHIKIFIS